MQQPFHEPRTLLDSNRKVMVQHLKVCPLCDTINSKLNGECFVCRWHGQFVHDPSRVEEGLVEMLDEYPELLDGILHIPQPKITLVQRVRGWLRTVLRRPLDLEV